MSIKWVTPSPEELAARGLGPKEEATAPVAEPKATKPSSKKKG